jgi:cell division protein FtsZ
LDVPGYKTNRSQLEKKSKTHHEFTGEDEPAQSADDIKIHQLDVDFEIVNAQDDDFEITEEPKVEQSTPSHGMLSFDFSEGDEEQDHDKSSSEKPKSYHDIEVNEPEEVNSTSNAKSTIKRYDLSEFMDDDEGKTKPNANKTTKSQTELSEEHSEDIQFVKRRVSSEHSETHSTEKREVDPMNTPLSELASRAAERRAKMKQFNHKFRNTNNIDEIEKQPAYKRAGVELDSSRPEAKSLSRTSVEGGKDDLNFRTNNSFLHDNVD